MTDRTIEEIRATDTRAQILLAIARDLSAAGDKISVVALAELLVWPRRTVQDVADRLARAGLVDIERHRGRGGSIVLPRPFPRQFPEVGKTENIGDRQGTRQRVANSPPISASSRQFPTPEVSETGEIDPNQGTDEALCNSTVPKPSLTGWSGHTGELPSVEIEETHPRHEVPPVGINHSDGQADMLTEADVDVGDPDEIAAAVVNEALIAIEAIPAGARKVLNAKRPGRPISRVEHLASVIGVDVEDIWVAFNFYSRWYTGTVADEESKPWSVARFVARFENHVQRPDTAEEIQDARRDRREREALEKTLEKPEPPSDVLRRARAEVLAGTHPNFALWVERWKRLGIPIPHLEPEEHPDREERHQ